MNIDAIIKIVKGIPRDKWSDEKTIKKAIKDAASASGKKLSDEELTKYTQQFKSLAQTKSPFGLIGMLLKSGITKEQISLIKKKMTK
ncbi:hypothetical protein PP175_12125 [Aneurinibacillus sp. Ricciae_BoGa-3]|uniref:hypothetical protein n=1 Tax=Aneurinibacillus sp. Ricciae_BoGa-3 TaxID=3022697 RepID=UPI0023419977|nr:hypothetical protein [Aneurinibacillus sp. Ricciae_BoGa-3]WCK56587.1 hypothetical protein PP175_12125 [Aneurinibacillus sp. Ricciae_BoGa-3]